MGHGNQNNCQWVENHNHEFLSSTNYEEDNEGTVHNHRIAGVTGPPIRYGNNSHVHRVEALTDTFDDHFHTINDTTGPAIYLDGEKHIHLLEGRTSPSDRHYHDYFFATLIENPSEVPENNKC